MSSNAYITLTEGGIHKLVKASDLIAESVDAAIVSKMASGVPAAKITGNLELAEGGLLKYVATGTPSIQYSTDGGISWKVIGAASEDSGTVTVAWSDITGEVSGSTKLQTALNGKSDVGHSHTISAISDLQSALDEKAASAHQHVSTDITDFNTKLATKANATHYHQTSDVTGLDTALANKALKEHTHTQASIEGLTNALTEKADSAHTHVITDVQQLSATLNAKASADSVTELASTVTAHTGNTVLHIPTTGTVGQVLTKTADGSTWQTIQTGSDGSVSYVLPAATASELGGIKVGTGLNIATDGTLSVSDASGGTTAEGAWGSITGTLSNQTDLQTALDDKATTAALTAVETTANSASTTATQAKETADTAKSTADTAKGTADAANLAATDANNNATAALNTAQTASTDATTAISTANTATTTANNAITLINNHAGTAALHVPQEGTEGQVLTKTATGSGWKDITIPDTYELPIATADKLGGVRIGSNLSIDAATGVLSATLPTDSSGSVTITATKPLQMDSSTNTLSIDAYPALTDENLLSTATVDGTKVTLTLTPGHSYKYTPDAPTFTTLTLQSAEGYEQKAGECFLWVHMGQTSYIEGAYLLDTPFPDEYNLLHITFDKGTLYVRVRCHMSALSVQGYTYGALRVLYPSSNIPDNAQWKVYELGESSDDTVWYTFGDIVTIPINGKPLVIQLKAVSGYTTPEVTYTGLCHDTLNTVVCNEYTITETTE